MKIQLSTKKKNIKCCKLIRTVYLKYLFKYVYNYSIYYVCIIQCDDFFMSRNLLQVFFNICREEDARTLFQEYNTAVTRVVPLAGIVTSHMQN